MRPQAVARWLGPPLTTACLLLSPLAAQTVNDVFPFEPAKGARVGPRPKFRIGVDGSNILNMRFRIELTRDDFDTIAYRFDQSEDRNGWAFVSVGFDQPGALYMVRAPLPDGVYDWRVYAWNGVEWIAGRTVSRVVVDSIPPAPVDGVRLRVDAERGAVELEWDPVVADRDGKPESVARYHVYRYFKRAPFHVITANRVATVEETHWVDTHPAALAGSLVFYKVTAEDEAGNETGRRYF